MLHKNFSSSFFSLLLLLIFYFGGLPGGSVVKSPPAMQEMPEKWVQSLGQEDFPEEKVTTHSSILAWRVPWARNLVGYIPQGHKELDTTEHALFYFYCYYLCSSLVSHQIWYYLNHDLRSYSCWILKIYWGYYKKLIGWENCPLEIFETQKTREIGAK